MRYVYLKTGETRFKKIVALLFLRYTIFSYKYSSVSRYAEEEIKKEARVLHPSFFEMSTETRFFPLDTRVYHAMCYRGES